MDRRSFTKTAVATVLGGVVAGNTFGVSKASDIAESSAPYKSKFAPHFGMLKASMTKAGIDVKKDFVSQLQFFHDCGFRALEDNGMMSRPVEVQEAIAKKMEQLGWEMGVFCAHTEWKLSSYSGNRLDTKIKKANGVIVRNPKEVREMLVARMEKAIEVGKRVNAKWCTVVPGLEDPTLEPEYQFANVVENLRYMCDVCAKTGIVMVLEPLNIFNHWSLYLKRIPQAYAICKAVNSPYCKILDDMYHQQITEGNLIPNFDAARSEIPYVQVGDVPGRKEPTTGEINYKRIFQHLWDTGYRGIIGMEHGQSDTSIEGDKKLLKAYRSVDVA
ncbi:MAG: xylose isomerase [Verrucomicrobiaceae bacterium]|nr:xylose isomerase [Verrucomicrobiaceae bacterium]